MTALTTPLLVAGLLFPALSLLTIIGSLLHLWRHKKHSSPVTVPFIGPILLTCWVVLAGKSMSLIPVVWIGDIGTLIFLAISPRLIRDWWQVSSLTTILTLHGSKGIQSVVLTLHSTGQYTLEKTWKRPAGEIGIVGLGELGVFTHAGDQYELTAHQGLRRILRKTDDGAYSVDEDQPLSADQQDYTLDGWVLKA